MALKPCRECKKKVSTEAKVCPRCGVPDPTILKRKIRSKTNLKGTGAGGWPKEYLAAQAELHGSSDDNEFNRYVEPSDWDRFTKNKVQNKVRSTFSSTSPKGIDDGFIFGFVRGDETLGKTFWLYFVLGNVVLNIIGLIIGDPLYKRESTFLLYFYIFISLAWNILATIGVFKSADNYKIQKKKLNQSYGYATAAKVAVVILILSAIGNAI